MTDEIDKCLHTYSVLQVTVQEGEYPQRGTYSAEPQHRGPDFTHVLLVCLQCGERAQECMPGRPAKP